MASTIKPPINLRVATTGLKKTRSTVSSLNKSTTSLRTKLSERIKFKRQNISSERVFRNKREQAEIRRDREDILEASGIKGATRRMGSIVSKSTRGFLGRILDFTGTLLIGWLVNNLPRIMKMARELMYRVRRLYQISTNFFDTVGNIFGDFNNVLGSILQNVMSFDFTDSSGRVRSSLEELEGNFDDLGAQFDEASSLLTTSLDEILDPSQQESEAPPPSQTPTPTQPSPSAPSVQSAEMYRIAAALSTEASGQQSIVDVMQVVVNRKASGRYGNNYTDILAAGTGGKNVAFEGVWKRPGGPKAFRKIQSLEDASRWSGQSKGSLLKIIQDIQNPALQSSAAKHVKGALEFRGSPQNYGGKRLKNSAWRGGANDNQFLLDPSQDPLRKEGAASFNLPKPVPQKPKPPSVQPPSVPGIDLSKTLNKGDVLTRTIGKGVDYVEITDTYKSRSGTHLGVDVAAPEGTYIALKYDCEVVTTGFYGNYGYLIDVWVPQLKVQLRMAHLKSVIVKSGKIPAGKSFARVGSTGRSTGPHIHFEYSTKRNDSTYGGSGDASPYVWALILSKYPNERASASKPQSIASKMNVASLIKPSSTPGIQTDKSQIADVRLASAGQTIIIIDEDISSPSSPPPPPQQQSPSLPMLAQNPLNSLRQKMLTDLAYT
jgi:murein DD-endopeptidase MepM/ murein hydrolase activator NlpD